MVVISIGKPVIPAVPNKTMDGEEEKKEEEETDSE